MFKSILRVLKPNNCDNVIIGLCLNTKASQDETKILSDLCGRILVCMD